MMKVLDRLTRSIVEIGGLAIAVFLPLWFNPWAERPFEAPKVTFFRVIAAAMIIAAVAQWLKSRPSLQTIPAGLRRFLSGNPLALPALAYGFVFALATVFSDDPGLSLWGSGDSPQAMVTVLCIVAFFLLLVPCLQVPDSRARMITALILGSVPVASYGIAQFFGLDPLPWVTDSISPILSTMGRSNFLGAYLAMVIPFTLLRITVEEEKLRYGLILSLQVTCLWLTMARAAWLSGMGSTFLFLGALARRWNRRRLWAVASVILIAGAGLFVLMNAVPPPHWKVPNPHAPEAQDFSFSELRAASVSARLTVWRATLSLIGRRPLLGYGPERFAEVFLAHYPLAVYDPHNLLLDQLMAAGMLGLASFLGVVVSFCHLTVRGIRRCTDRYTEAALAAVLASATAFLIQAQFNPDVITITVFFWLVMALGAGMACKDEQDEPLCPTTVISAIAE